MPLRGGLCRKVVFASLRGAKVKRFLRWTGLKAGGVLKFDSGLWTRLRREGSEGSEGS